MSQKTENFKTTQIPLWEDGDIASGANFRQFITSIATLVDDTKEEIMTSVTSGYPDTEALTRQTNESIASAVNALKSEILNTVDSKNTNQSSELRAELTSRLRSVSESLEAKLGDFITNTTYNAKIGEIDRKLEGLTTESIVRQVLEELADQVNGSSSESLKQYVNEYVTNAISGLVTNESLSAKVSELNATIESKVGTDTLTQKVSELTASINNKASTTELTQKVNELKSLVATKAESTEVSTLKRNFENINATVTKLKQYHDSDLLIHKFYTYKNNTLYLHNSISDSTGTSITVTDGNQFLQDTGTTLHLAQPLNTSGDMLLVRPDGAVLVFTRDNGKVKPLTVLIG